MSDIPIIFSAPMVRALLDGRKTMTRRLAWKVEPVWSSGGVIYDAAGGQEDYVEPHWVVKGKPSAWQRVRSGDRLWVRENFQTAYTLDTKSMKDVAVAALEANYRRPWCPIKYASDGKTDNWTATDWGDFGKLRPCIFMPLWASRLTLIVTATKIERLQEISEAEAIAEGSRIPLAELPPAARMAAWSERQAFKHIWDALHGPDSWEANPEVVALTFTVHKINIDQLPKAEVA